MSDLIPDDLERAAHNAWLRNDLNGDGVFPQPIIEIYLDHNCADGYTCSPVFEFAQLTRRQYTADELADRRTPLPWLDGAA